MDVLIEFVNDNKMLLTEAENYGYTSDGQFCFVKKNGHKILFNVNQVRYIGNSADIDGGLNQYVNLIKTALKGKRKRGEK